MRVLRDMNVSKLVSGSNGQIVHCALHFHLALRTTYINVSR